MSQVDGKTYRALRDLAQELYEALKGLQAGMNDAVDSKPLVKAEEVRRARDLVARYEREMKP